MDEEEEERRRAKKSKWTDEKEKRMYFTKLEDWSCLHLKGTIERRSERTISSKKGYV